MDTALRPAVPPLPAVTRRSDGLLDAGQLDAGQLDAGQLDAGPLDAGQEFVNRVRAAAPAFAAAAAAETAVVREVVPPARHRRSRCRLVLRFPGEVEVDLTFLGPVSRGHTPDEDAFELQIQTWLAGDRSNEQAWLVPDDESPDGLAVDVPAWARLDRPAAV